MAHDWVPGTHVKDSVVFLAPDLCLSLCLLKDWGTFVFKTCSNMKNCTLSNWYGRGRKLVNREMKIFPFFLGPITLHPSSMPYFLIYYFQFPVMQLRFLHMQKTMWTHVPQTPHGSTMKIFTEFITHAEHHPNSIPLMCSIIALPPPLTWGLLTWAEMQFSPQGWKSLFMCTIFLWGVLHSCLIVCALFTTLLLFKISI